MTEQDLLDIEASLEPHYYILEWNIPEEEPKEDDAFDPEDHYGPFRYGPFTQAEADAREVEAKAKGVFASRNTTRKLPSRGIVDVLIAEIRRLHGIVGEGV